MSEPIVDYDLIRPSSLYATQGLWSGTERRHRKHYIAVIPASRYLDDEDFPELPLPHMAREAALHKSHAGILKYLAHCPEEGVPFNV